VQSTSIMATVYTQSISICLSLQGSMSITYLSMHNDRNDNLTPAFCVAGNVSRELGHIGDDKCLLLRSRGAAHTLSEFNQLASGLAMERTQQQGLFLVHRGICS